jgi:hypothetical protein
MAVLQLLNEILDVREPYSLQRYCVGTTVIGTIKLVWTKPDMLLEIRTVTR